MHLPLPHSGLQSAEVELSNRGDIDLYVYGMDGKLIRSDRRTNRSAHVSFVPPTTNRYRVVLRAFSGSSPILYRLNTN